jgi:hypothetical protein
MKNTDYTNLFVRKFKKKKIYNIFFNIKKRLIY